MAAVTARRHVDGDAAPENEFAAIDHALWVIVRQLTSPSAWGEMKRAAGAEFPHDLERSAYPLLGAIGREGPIRPSDLTVQMGVQISTISRQVAELERRHLVTREVDPSDRRAITFTLSDHGERVLAAIRKVRYERLRARLIDWSHDDRADLARLLGRLAESFAPELYAGFGDLTLHEKEKAPS